MSRIDINYYLSQQLHPVVSRLIDPLDGTDSSRIANCLGLDPDQYRKSITHEVSPEEESSMKEEDKFRQCEKLQVRRSKNWLKEREREGERSIPFVDSLFKCTQQLVSLGYVHVCLPS